MFVPYQRSMPASQTSHNITALPASVSLANLAVSDPYDVWLMTPERSSIDRVTVVSDAEVTFSAVTVQFVQKNGPEVIEVTQPQAFESLSPTVPLELGVPSNLPELPLFMRFEGPSAPIDAFITVYLIAHNIS